MKKISVVILTKNSQKHIRTCIKSVLMQKYPDFEIIVVDADTKDNTKNIILEEFNFNYKGDILTIFPVPENTSIGKSRQIGVDNSKGEYIAFIDSDVELPHENWLENMSKPLREGYFYLLPNSIAGTQTLAKYRESDPWILKYLHNSFEYENKIISIRNYEMVGTGHCIVKKEDIKSVGGFRDIQSHEDIDLTKKIMETNKVFIYLPKEKVYHYHVDGFWHYIKKHIIRNKILALRRHLIE